VTRRWLNVKRYTRIGACSHAGAPLWKVISAMIFPGFKLCRRHTELSDTIDTYYKCMSPLDQVSVLVVAIYVLRSEVIH
jgi:hypothetical protein